MTRSAMGRAVIGLVALGAVLAPGGRAGAASWSEVAAPEGRTLVVATARPTGPGPHPVVVVLHGTGGFSQGYVSLAEDFARAGFVAVAGCWFSGNHFPPAQRARLEGRRAPSPMGEEIACPQGPDFQGASLAANRYVMSLIETARRLPDVRADRVGLFGHSRGAQAAVIAASAGARVRAVVASAGGYLLSRRGDTRAIDLAGALEAPVLLLHGTADETVDVGQTRQYARTLGDLGKPFGVHYYEGATHLLPFLGATREDVLTRAIAFFRAHLGA